MHIICTQLRRSPEKRVVFLYTEDPKTDPTFRQNLLFTIIALFLFPRDTISKTNLHLWE